ncbi:pentatricopeptide repeat-containing protein DOT4, chloroplastic [Oryza sativa Japonica Group]|uniref:pentatricopeptide repeat-containing protein DOT4, chloroplastic n=1 Tax=Oryza sativa subsp. japonica TaxID=39947 RepID=UPI000009E296|nr:pentatricopeptide repeat-containing protein DOT4, chloroplastic [Oryza sativa Japonica Group]
MATPPLTSVSSHLRAPPPWPPPKNSSPRTRVRCDVLAASGHILEAASAPRGAKNSRSRAPRTDVDVQIERLCRAGELEEALRLLGSDGVDARSYGAVVQLCSDLRSLEAGKRAHFLVRASGVGKDGMDSVLGRKLVLMYVKCGDLENARKVFDEMPQVSDVRVWTSLMSGYAKAGEFQDGVLLFRQMHCSGVRPDAHAISCVLKCIAGLGSIADGEVVHGYLEKLGLGVQCAVGNALIALYSRCGHVDGSLQVFDGMPHRDVISWNSVISGCFSNGWHGKSIELFAKMWSEGLEINPVTMLGVLPACAELGYNLVGRVLHGYSVKTGLLWEFESLENGIDENLGSKLVFMYVKCGELGYARKVFDAMSSKSNLHAWNLMMGGYAKLGKFQESLLLFEKMHDCGITPDEHTISCLLKCITGLSGVMDGLVVHGYLVKYGFGAQCAVCNALISFYAKSNRIEDALMVFDEMPQRDIISWNSIIGGCASNGLYDKAVELFVRMWLEGQELDSTTLLSVMPACVQSHYSFIGGVVHGYSVRTGLISETSLGNALLDMYSNCSDWRSTNKIFRNMEQKNVVSWTAMITSYTRAGHFDKVAGLFQEMGLEGIRPDVFAITSALDAFAGNESLKHGKSVHGYAIRNGIEEVLPVANALMEMYVKCGYMEEARFIFDHVTKKDTISWNTLIGGYSRSNLANEAFTLFNEMLLQLRPNAVTMACILPAAASLSSLERGREMHAYAVRRGYLEDNFVANALVDMYVKCGALLLARRLFDMLTNKNLISWTIMIAGYGMHGRGRDAIALFEQMKGSGIQPDAGSFSAILYACSHSGLRDEGWRFFNAMRNEHRIEPKLKHYACMVDLLCHTGNLKEAYEFIETMPIEPDSSIWVSLLRGCRIHRNVKLAEKVAEMVFELEPENTGYYVLLANIYAEAERWEAVRKLKNKVGGRGLRENTGCSWIEVRGKAHIFFAENRNHPQGMRIAEFLDDVARRMQEEGHDPKKKYALMGADDAVHDEALCGHSSKLAVAFGVLNLSQGRPIRVTKNSRVCSHCHEAAKFISKMCGREIILRDSNRFHHFEEGRCSCRGYW